MILEKAGGGGFEDTKVSLLLQMRVLSEALLHGEPVGPAGALRREAGSGRVTPRPAGRRGSQALLLSWWWAQRETGEVAGWGQLCPCWDFRAQATSPPHEGLEETVVPGGSPLQSRVRGAALPASS